MALCMCRVILISDVKCGIEWCVLGSVTECREVLRMQFEME